MEKKKKILITLLLLGVLTTGGYLLFNFFFGPGEGVIQATGTIEATTVELNARVAGVLKTISVKTGDTVKKGQLVVEILRSDLLAQRERDELSVIKAEAAYYDLVSGARAQEKNEAAANVNIARANYSKLADDLKKAQALMEAGAVSQGEVDNLKTALEISKNQLEAAEARLSLVEAGSRPEQIKAAQVEVERSRAVLKATEAMLEDLKIYAPLDGLVLNKNYQEGEFVQMGASIATIADLDDLWIRVFIPTDDLPRIKLGQKVKFTVSGISRSYEGIVEEIAGKGEFTPKTIQTKRERANVVFGVKIRINSEGGVLKPGMPADVTFEQ